MFFFHTVRRTRVGQAAIGFDCTACGRRNLEQLAVDEREQMMLLGFIPFVAFTNTWIHCPACGRRSRADRSSVVLAEMDPAERRRHIGGYIALPARLLAALSPVLFFMPIIGLV